MKDLLEFLGGIGLFILGMFLLLSNVSVSTLTFYRLGGTLNTAPLLVILLVVFIILVVIKCNWFTGLLVVADIILIAVSVIMGTTFHFKRLSAFELIVMLAFIGVGIGLTIKSLLSIKKSDLERSAKKKDMLEK